MRSYSLAGAGSQERAIHPEIQGMRAIAVLIVIAAHARLPGLAGGFTGVDMFFVISGFLITRLLLGEMALTGRIDLPRFWARRARRLLPNAYATLLATVLIALFLFPGYNPQALAREIVFAALEIANFHFADKAVDYFQSDSPASPVLHFWSLAVEEQFYMVWPLLLLGIGLWFRGGFRRATLIVLALIVCASFAASLWFTIAEQPVAYFNTGTRCWQLGVGALLAAGWSSVERLPPALRAAMAWLGLSAILAGVAILHESRGYPGHWALLPTLGAAGLLAGFEAAAPAGLLRRGLSLPVMQWLGARSYSWYLWHWPLLALPRVAMPDSPSIELIAVPTSLAIASAAYAWLENPVRQSPRLAAAPLRTLAGSAVCLGLVVLAGFAYMPALSVVDNALSTRFEKLRLAMADASQADKDKCQTGTKQLEQKECLYGDRSAGRRIVLFGDSHAIQWFPALDRAARENGWQLNSWTKNTCPPADVTVLYKDGPYPTCKPWRDSIFTKLTQSAPDLVVMANVSAYAEMVVDDKNGKVLSPTEGAEAFREGMRKTIRKLLGLGISVLIIRDTPVADDDYRTCYINGLNCVASRQKALADAPLNVEVAREFGDSVVVADFTDEICDRTTCPVMRNGLIVYRDRTHLTPTYAATFAPQMARLLRGFAEKRTSQSERRGPEQRASALGQDATKASN